MARATLRGEQGVDMAGVRVRYAHRLHLFQHTAQRVSYAEIATRSAAQIATHFWRLQRRSALISHRYH
jgi:hypothetical protein